MAEQHQDDHDHDDHGGMGKYLVVFLCLLGLTILSFVSGTFLIDPEGGDPGARTVGWVVMMAISCAKALLVMLFFMHLIWEANWKYVLTIPATVMSMLVVLALVPDIGRRYENYSEERMRYAPEVSLHNDAGHGEAGEGDHAGDSHEGESQESDAHGGSDDGESSE